MDISSNKVDKIGTDLQTGEIRNIKKDKAGNPPVSAEDQVELSARALDMQALQNQTKVIPDINQEKVEGIKLQLTNGAYRISNEELAEKILGDYTQEK